MKLRIFFVKVVSIMLISILLYLNISIASTESDLRNEQSEINNKIDDLKDEQGEITANKTDALNTIDGLTKQINSYESEISDLNTKIEDLNANIVTLQTKIDEATAEYNKQSDLLDTRLLTIYQAGQTTYLDVLLGAKDFSDFISSYHLISVVTENDKELMEKIKKQKEEIETSKKELEDSKNSVEQAKKEVEEKNNQLKQSKDEKTNLVNQLSAEEKEIQRKIDELVEDQRKIQAELEEIAKQYPSVTEPSDCGYIFPVAGLTRANIRTKTYPSYAGHTGVDVNINVIGKTVVAVKAGTVITSTALKNPNGTYRSYGEYIVIDHHDGTMTLYAHGLEGSRRVSPGQKVSQGQALMTVGSTGNSTGPHLHFEVRVGGKPVNPFPYLP